MDFNRIKQRSGHPFFLVFHVISIYFTKIQKKSKKQGKVGGKCVCVKYVQKCTISLSNTKQMLRRICFMLLREIFFVHCCYFCSPVADAHSAQGPPIKRGTMVVPWQQHHLYLLEVEKETSCTAIPLGLNARCFFNFLNII